MNHRIEVRIDGAAGAPPLLLCNSLGTDLSMWTPQLPRLAARFRVIRFDARGHGGSQAPPGPYTLDDFGGDALRVLDGAGVARAHVCGLSLGGLVAQWLALRAPERVGRAVFANTAAQLGVPALWRERAEVVQARGMLAVRDAVLARFFGDGFRRAHPELVAPFAETLARVDPGGYAGACLALGAADLRAEVGAIRAPALVIGGAEDRATPPADAAALHDAIPGSALVVLEGAAHLSNVERPEAFTDLVERFFSVDLNVDDGPPRSGGAR